MCIRDRDKYYVLLQTDDEVLDYTMAAERYDGARLTIEQGGNHSFEGFENHLASIMDFLGV